MVSVRRRARAGAVVVTVCVAALLWQACGGGGGGSGNSGGSGDNGGGDNTTPGTNTRTPTPRPSGSPPLTQPGQAGTPTPTSEESPTPPGPDTVLVFPGESIADAARSASDGTIVIVAPGSYSAVVIDPGDLQGSITLFADVTGEFTDSPPSPVTVVARSTDQAAFEIFSQSGLTIDGFTVRGGTDAGILFGDSSGITIQDCTIISGGGDAVHFERSDDILVFNNVLSGNKGGGVTAFGTTNLQIINNTIYNNAADGIFLSLDENNNPSTNAFVRNNILNNNKPTGIVVDPGPPTSLDGFDSDFNLNTNGYDGTDAGPDDISADPLFIFPAGNDFHLAAASRAIDRGTDAIDQTLISQLAELTTQTDGTLDTPPGIDLGYHYVPPILTPTRAPRATPTNTPRVTASRTGSVPPGATATHTRTPTHTATGPTATPTPAGKPTRTAKPTKTPRP